MKSTTNLKPELNRQIYDVYCQGEKIETFTATVDSRDSDFFNIIDEQITKKYGTSVDRVNHSGRTISLI